MNKAIIFFTRFKLLIQAIFFTIINSDIFTLIKSIRTRTAGISQTRMKVVCVPGLNCYSCPSAVTSCPIGSIQFWFNDIARSFKFGKAINPAGFYIIGFLSLIGSIAGRICCGWICPFGFIQDLINKITGLNKKIPVILRVLRYVSLFGFVIILPLFILDLAFISPWFCKLLCPAGTLLAGIPLLLVDSSLRESASFITILKFAILIIFLVSFLISRRSFCKTLCPLGAFWGFFNKISLYKLKIDKNKCINCKTCEKICTMNIKVLSNENSTECIRCFECIKKCPVSCISFELKHEFKIKLLKKQQIKK